MTSTSKSRRPVPKLTKLKIYEGTAEVTGKPKGKEDWTDESVITEPGYLLSVLNDKDMDRECKIFLYGLRVKMSHRAAGSALLLTWNMRDINPTETRLFPEVDAGKDLKDQPLSVLESPGEIYQDKSTDDLFDGQDGFLARQAVSFLAASTLKLFSKSVNSWIKAWENGRIADRFNNFTKKSFPFRELEIAESRISVLTESFQGPKIFVYTLGKILYALSDIEDIRQTTMLFEQHLNCTGLHIVPQFINARLALGSSTEDLLCALDMRQNTASLLQLKYLIDNSLSRQRSSDNRGTWSYSRLFDETAFQYLQTKYCQDTVAILAYINTMTTGSRETSNPLNIAVVRQMGAARLRGAKLVAENIFMCFTVREERRREEKRGEFLRQY